MFELLTEKAIKYYSTGWNYSITALIIFLLFFICDLYIRKDDSTYTRLKHKNSSLIFDLSVFAYDFLRLYPILVLVFSFGVPYIIKKNSGLESPYVILSSFSNAALQTLIYFIIIDFLSYWYHRGLHRISFLWELHKIHHSADSMNFLTSNRRHPLEQGIKQLFLFFPLLLVGSPIESYVILSVFYITTGYLHHSGLKWDFGLIGKYILVSPKYHLIHHSISKQHYDKNFSARLVWWDKIFGTYAPTSEDVLGVGLHGSNHNELGFIRSIIDAQKRFSIQLYISIKNILYRTK